MKEKDSVAPYEEISHVGLGRSKSNLLCLELKQLYVAITRSRQRLWICEDTNDYSRPIFEYWKKLRLVEVRLLDSSLIRKMQTGSSTDDWRLQGTKVSVLESTSLCNATCLVSDAVGSFFREVCVELLIS
jgi:hypothetical protein